MAGDARKAAILALPVGRLAAAIARGEFTAVEVLKAFRERAEEVNQACNAVTYWIEESEEAARHADDHLRTTGSTLGPLHGVPFTVKDHVEAARTPTTLNLVTIRRRVEEARRAGKKVGPSKDNPLVAALRSLGAIPFAKTTMSQMGETWGGGGAAFGDTLNPWDTLRTSGGSSAGEGVLVGSCASPFGIGSDIGGSLRIPSAFCGISTLKPTTGRLSLICQHPGDYSIPATLGMMAKSAEDVSLLYSWLFSCSLLYDEGPRLVRIPFDRVEYSSSRKLRIGYYLEEYTSPMPCPTARRAVTEAIEALRRAGHELVPFHPHSQGIVTKEEFWGADVSFGASQRPPRVKAAEPEGGKREAAEAKKAAEPEGGKEEAAEAKLRAAVLPSWVNKDEPVHPDIAANATMHPGIRLKGFKNASDEGVPGWLDLLDRRDALRKRFYGGWRQAGLDALVCPAWGLPSCQVEEVRHLSKIIMTTRVYNFLDMPAGVVPTTRVTEADLRQPYEPGHPDPEVNRAALRCLEGAEGLPMAVQVVAAPWREELVLRVMRELEAALPFGGGHADLRPVPRRSPTLGARPEPVEPRAKL